ncbi:MAG: dockerin type I repeat-containing protein [Clostridia bacterium]|nr:dockerin type I repeat-containing protein [Clostridia bacterium]
MQAKVQNVNLALTATKTTKTNFIFAGWSESDYSSVAPEPKYYRYGTNYTYTANTAKTLYAVWGKKGDVDLNGMVNIEDTLVVQSVIMGTPAKNYYRITGDVNGDGVVNVDDILLIRDIIFGI